MELHSNEMHFYKNHQSTRIAQKDGCTSYFAPEQMAYIVKVHAYKICPGNALACSWDIVHLTHTQIYCLHMLQGLGIA